MGVCMRIKEYLNERKGQASVFMDFGFKDRGLYLGLSEKYDGEPFYFSLVKGKTEGPFYFGLGRETVLAMMKERLLDKQIVNDAFSESVKMYEL